MRLRCVIFGTDEMRVDKKGRWLGRDAGGPRRGRDGAGQSGGERIGDGRPRRRDGRRRMRRPRPRQGRARLIIDPIDGTEEFSRGIPTFGTLLGIEREGEIVAGMVSAPALGTRWWAYRGEGAWRNGKRMRVSKVELLKGGMVLTGGTGPNSNRRNTEKMRLVLDAARYGRSFGGFWQHMLVAEGSIEAAVDLHSKPWDLAPAGLIVEEAGGRATDVNGKRTIYSGSLVSTNGKIHEEVLTLLQ